jgi:hypothetical protein
MADGGFGRWRKAGVGRRAVGARKLVGECSSVATASPRTGCHWTPLLCTLISPPRAATPSSSPPQASPTRRRHHRRPWSTCGKEELNQRDWGADRRRMETLTPDLLSWWRRWEPARGLCREDGDHVCRFRPLWPSSFRPPPLAIAARCRRRLKRLGGMGGWKWIRVGLGWADEWVDNGLVPVNNGSGAR